MITLNPASLDNAAAFCLGASSFLWNLHPDASSAIEPQDFASRTLAALHVLTEPTRKVLSHPNFTKNEDRLSAFANHFVDALPEEERETQKTIYERNFKPSAGLSEDYQASQYFRALITQMLQGLQVCSPESWSALLETMPLENYRYVADVLELFNDYDSARIVRQRGQERAAELFWKLLCE